MNMLALHVVYVFYYTGKAYVALHLGGTPVKRPVLAP